MGFTRQLLLHWLLSTRWKLIQEQQVFYLRRQKRDKTSNGYIDLLIQYYIQLLDEVFAIARMIKVD